MKRAGLLLMFLTILAIGTAKAQHTEISVHLNTGLFSFGGASADKAATLIVSDVSAEGNYTSNPYGALVAPSYGLALQAQRVTGGNMILGLQGGYEAVRSRIRINAISGDIFTNSPPVSGKTILSNRFLHFFPNLGRRFAAGLLELDVTLGPEFALTLESREKGKAEVYNNIDVTSDREVSDPGTDIRIRLSSTLYYRNWGFSAGYSYGLHNYTGVGGENETFARYLRLGLIYRIR